LPFNKKLKKLGFLFTDTFVPTWWTQYPSDQPLLTGWIGGPAAAALNSIPEEQILQQALHALSTIFKLNRSLLETKLKAFQVVNWGSDPFSYGAYVYTAVHSIEAKKILLCP